MRFSAEMLHQSLLQDLSSHIDLNAPSWSIDSTVTQVACYRQREALLKKFNQEDSPSEAACSKALVKFLSVNERLASWKKQFNFMWEEELYNLFKLEVADFWDSSQRGDIFSCYNQLFSAGRTGPGASIGAKGYDFYTKMFCSPVSSTESLSDVWRVLIAHNPQFARAYMQRPGGLGIKIVDHNRLSFVNKNQAIARSICTEPTANMWCQLGLGSILEKRLLQKYGIDLSFQPEINQRLALLGSLKDHLVTIDLESASDSLGLPMLEDVLPRSFMRLLMRLRSPVSRLPDGSKVALNMVSTMGNGFTFPLQTMLFSCACIAVYRYLGIPVKSRGDWDDRNMAVFGDDIIVDRRIARHLMHLLQMLGFVVNSDKTYVEGPFRESCGVDAFLGIDVRPVYLKRLRTLQDSFVAINRLNHWTAKTGVALRHTVSYVLSVFPRARSCQVPLDEGDTAGIKTPLALLDRPARSFKRVPGLLRYTKSVPAFNGYRVDVQNERLVRHPRNATFDPEGLFIAFLGGYICRYRVSLRTREVRYITKRSVTPRWDYLPGNSPDRFLSELGRFVTAFRANL